MSDSNKKAKKQASNKNSASNLTQDSAPNSGSNLGLNSDPKPASNSDSNSSSGKQPGENNLASAWAATHTVSGNLKKIKTPNKRTLRQTKGDFEYVTTQDEQERIYFCPPPKETEF